MIGLKIQVPTFHNVGLSTRLKDSVEKLDKVDGPRVIQVHFSKLVFQACAILTSNGRHFLKCQLLVVIRIDFVKCTLNKFGNILYIQVATLKRCIPLVASSLDAIFYGKQVVHKQRS